MAEYKDITGLRFGSLTALRPAGANKRRQMAWQCICDCGTESTVSGVRLRNGSTKSCGCAQRKSVVKRNRTHGHYGCSTYRSWNAMNARCSNPNLKCWDRYGGRGIQVCDRWRSFENFLADMGERPEGMTLDRYPNPDGNYEPGNCRWANQRTQMTNMSRNRHVEFEGERLTLAQWARRLNIYPSVLSKRYSRGDRPPHLFRKPVIGRPPPDS